MPINPHRFKFLRSRRAVQAVVGGSAQDRGSRSLVGKAAHGNSLVVHQVSPAKTRGVLAFGSLRIAVALGRTGVLRRKREGDGATPSGAMQLLSVLYNPHRTRRPATALPLTAIARTDGWCDAAGDRNYNRTVVQPYTGRAEHLWRDDGLYDVVVVLDYNIDPRVKGRGSAIFMHVARPGLLPTEGCIAMPLPQLKRLLAVVRRGARLHVGG